MLFSSLTFLTVEALNVYVLFTSGVSPSSIGVAPLAIGIVLLSNKSFDLSVFDILVTVLTLDEVMLFCNVGNTFSVLFISVVLDFINNASSSTFIEEVFKSLSALSQKLKDATHCPRSASLSKDKRSCDSLTSKSLFGISSFFFLPIYNISFQRMFLSKKYGTCNSVSHIVYFTL